MGEDAPFHSLTRGSARSSGVLSEWIIRLLPGVGIGQVVPGYIVDRHRRWQDTHGSHRVYRSRYFSHVLLRSAVRHDVGLQSNLFRNHREKALGAENPSKRATSLKDRLRSSR